MTDQDQFVVITDPKDNEPIELPMADDGTLTLSTLDHAFPGAYGLKYKNPATGAKRVVPLDESGKNFLPPPGGWTNKTFEIIFRQVPAEPIGDKNKGTSGGDMNKSDDGKKSEESKTTTTKRPHEMVCDNQDGDERDRMKIELDAEGLSRAENVARKRTRRDERDDHNAVAIYDEDDLEGLGGEDGDGGGRDEDEATEKGRASGEGCVDMIVMGLPFDLDDDAFRDYFEQFGPVAYYEIKRKKNGNSRGFGFVRMANYTSHVKALSKIQHIIGGRECNVRISSNDKNVEFYLNKIVESRACPRLFVGGIAEGISKDRLREFINGHLRRFDRTGQVHDMYFPRPFRGFAFMTVSSQKAAREMVRQKDFMLDGQMVGVTVAVPRKDEEMPPQHQPWAVPPAAQNAMPSGRAMQPQSQQQYAAGNGGGYGGLSGDGRFPSEQIWNGRGEVAPSNGGQMGHGGGGGMGGRGAAGGYTNAKYAMMDNFGANNYPPNNYYPPQQQQRPPRQAAYSPGFIDQREDARRGHSSRAAGGPPLSGVGGGGGDIWLGAGGSNISPAHAEAILNQLPNDAVGTALKMLQSIMTTSQMGPPRRGGEFDNGFPGGPTNE